MKGKRDGGSPSAPTTNTRGQKGWPRVFVSLNPLNREASLEQDFVNQVIPVVRVVERSPVCRKQLCHAAHHVRPDLEVALLGIWTVVEC